MRAPVFSLLRLWFAALRILSQNIKNYSRRGKALFGNWPNSLQIDHCAVLFHFGEADIYFVPIIGIRSAGRVYRPTMLWQNSLQWKVNEFEEKPLIVLMERYKLSIAIALPKEDNTPQMIWFNRGCSDQFVVRDWHQPYYQELTLKPLPQDELC